ncbi:hypothetical protein [Paraburkholderia kururiensis]|uniref:Uncharacterized protein n=1 Tax=Paraburkholderia kururiensis TaxID=984307 RepID=A0ABZ0WM69_9BURK|nr:hypothetical protein U0042_01125 [Paraburkholderia kururiensis]
MLPLQMFGDDGERHELWLGGVCYGETDHAIAVADHVRTGFIWGNSAGMRNLEAPFGRIKRSGISLHG